MTCETAAVLWQIGFGPIRSSKQTLWFGRNYDDSGAIMTQTEYTISRDVGYFVYHT